jgi:hypothetical protein
MLKGVKYCINKIPKGLTENLTYLELAYPFDQPINNLPSSIETLKIGHTFNQPIDNLPGSIKYLIFSEHGSFNQSVDYLPSSIEKIEFNSDFNHPIDNLGNKVKYLRFGEGFKHPINSIVKQLKKLEISFNHYYKFNENYLDVEFDDDCEVIFTIIYFNGDYEFEPEKFDEHHDEVINKMKQKHKNLKIKYKLLD